MTGFAVEEKGGGPFFSVGTLRVSVSPTSIYRRALVLSAVSIESPSLRVVREAADRFNFSDILERQKKTEEKPKSAGVFPFVLNRFQLTGGAFELDDRIVGGGRKHSMRNLEIALPWLSSLPAEANLEAAPKISAVINGAPFSLTGKVKPFGKEIESAVRITLDKLDLPELWAYVPKAPPVDLSSGKLSLDMDIVYRQPAGKPELGVKGLARLDAVDLNLAKGKPLLKLPSLTVKASRLEPMAGLFEIESVALTGLELFVSRDRKGEWMYASLLPPKASARADAAKEKEAPPAPTAPLAYSVASFTLQNGRVHFRDELPKAGFKAEVEEISLALSNVANRPEQTGKYDLSLNVDKEVRLASQGSFTLVEPAAKAAIRLTGLPLQKGWPYLASYVTAPLKGTVDLSGEVAFSEKERPHGRKGKPRRQAVLGAIRRQGGGESGASDRDRRKLRPEGQQAFDRPGPALRRGGLPLPRGRREALRPIASGPAGEGAGRRP